LKKKKKFGFFRYFRNFESSKDNIVRENLFAILLKYNILTDEQIREINLYTNRNCITPLGQFLGDNFNLPQMYNELKQTSNYEARLASVHQFNQANRWKKRGISVVPIKYGLHSGYAGGVHALININGSDGTVVVFHGGCEIGQGMHTKVAQTVAMTLNCPLSLVRIGDVNTDVSPNSNLTGGSVGTEGSMEAARLACVKMNERLSPLRNKIWKETGKEPDWIALIGAAKAVNVLLSEAANYVPLGREEDFGRLPWVKHWADYYVYGVACTEAEVDVLTGEVRILRSDVLYDNGQSINPLIDMGQAEGAFVMGVGYFLREEVLTGLDGTIIAKDTWEYKPPCSHDVPQDFRLAFVKNSNFPSGVMNQKAIGEPPMVLAYSVSSAVRAAIKSSREERHKDPIFRLDGPFTVDRIQQAFAVTPHDFTF